MGKKIQNYDVVVIGGGITGAGVARDCAMRGLRVVLLEAFDITHGATGRNHGLMHSGARYVMSDPENAKECIRENRILRRIARHCVEETDGLFVSLPDDDLDYQRRFIKACLKAGISAEELAPDEALAIEPSVNPKLIGAVRVPDAAIDPFRLTIANVLDAQMHGATVLTNHRVTGILVESGTVAGVEAESKDGKFTFLAPVVVNAAGAWCQQIASLAGVTINMFPARGALLIFGHRVNHMVINRCRKPSNGDILVPDDIVCVLGTTSNRVPIEEIDNTCVTAQEVDLLLQEGVKLVPSLERTRILRAYAGVRPLVALGEDDSGRNISRGIVLFDHKERDGLDGFITITGGKMMTYRLMAQKATDLVCRKLGVTAVCATATRPLPGSEPVAEPDDDDEVENTMSFAHRAALGRHGTRVEMISEDKPEQRALVCECEHVSHGEVNYAIKELKADSMEKLRRRTRLGMGTCQGKMCACRAASLFSQADGDVERHVSDLKMFLNERWKGIRPIAWGSALSEAQLSAMTYQSLCGIDRINYSSPTDSDKQ